MYRIILNIFGYDVFKVLDKELVRAVGNKHKDCNIRICYLEDLSSEEDAFIGGKEIPDVLDRNFSSSSLTPGIVVIRKFGKIAFKGAAYYNDIRKVK